jgi:hypothetical protein
MLPAGEGGDETGASGLPGRVEMIQRKSIVEITLSPDELAFEFANMGDEQQAMFFNELARITAKWDRPFCFQLQYVVDHPELTREGRSIMELIGDYGRELPRGAK